MKKSKELNKKGRRRLSPQRVFEKRAFLLGAFIFLIYSLITKDRTTMVLSFIYNIAFCTL